MSLTVRYDPEGRFVETVNIGIATHEDLTKEAEQAIALAKENECALFLCDYSRSDVNFSAVDVYELPALYVAEGLERSARIAVISPQSKAGAQMAQFHETVSVNRGWNAQLFDERQDALDWLLGSRP